MTETLTLCNSLCLSLFDLMRQGHDPADYYLMAEVYQMLLRAWRGGAA